MSKKFKYLKKYVGHNDLKGTYFLPVKEEDIRLAEQTIGTKFPSELKTFYQEIGDGILSCGEKYPEMFIDSGGNLILPPLVVSAFYKPLEGDTWTPDDGPIDAGDGEHYMDASTYEILEPGDLPFFEIADSTSFMVMKPHSTNSNAVWYMGQEKIEDSFEEFIWKLYYENPWYWEKKLA